MRKYFLFFACFLMLSSVARTGDERSTNKEAKPETWYNGLFFKNSSLNFESIRVLGEAYYQGSDIGEVIATLRKVDPEDINTWYKEWVKTADRVYKLAEDFKKNKDLVSAKETFFRASNYYRAAGFYLDAEEERHISCDLSDKSIKSFKSAINYLSYIKPVKIPYKNTILPGYFLKSKIRNAPLLIVFTGYDGTKEELFFSSGKAAFDRGYNVILFEGPGQGEVIRKQNIPFRYDWERVVSPVIDYAGRLPDINKDKIAIMGRSMGGYLAPRAAAFDDRIKACIANGGVYSFAEPVLKHFPSDFLTEMKADPEEFNKEIYKITSKNLEFSWFINNGVWTFGVKTPAEFFEKLKEYTLKGCVKNIKCDMLVIDSSDDMFMKGQPQKLYSELDCPKTLLIFDYESTGEAHCQEGANAISNERIFSWLNKVFDFYPYVKE